AVAAPETFSHPLKTESLSPFDFSTREEAGLAIFDYVEAFYTRNRLHSSLDCPLFQGKIRSLGDVVPTMRNFLSGEVQPWSAHGRSYLSYSPYIARGAV